MNLENASNEVIRSINIEEELRTSYINYAMSVIIARALPDVRDGLKPVHRRIIYIMRDQGLLSNRPTRKSAKIVGDCIGRFHPHGDSAVYDALVRMAQGWNMRYPLVEGQGNFGSIDGDPPAAYRYTEARMTRFAELLLADIDRNTVDFAPNFDETEEEPLVLPSRAPNLLVNGSAGIAVGMATNVPPHNLNEVIDACVAMIDDPKMTWKHVAQLIQGPDFPTGAAICGRAGILEAYKTGRGRVQVRATAGIEVDERRGRESIVVTEIPYMINKAALIEEAARLVRDKKLEGISDIRDESDRDGLRIVIDLKRGENADIVLNNLYKHTRLQTTFSIILLALVDNRPVYLSIDQMIRHFLQHRREVIVRRTRHDLVQAEARAHILEGYIRAIDAIDAVIALIRASADAQTAKQGLVDQFDFSERQAQAILDMRLHRLTGLEREQVVQEHTELLKNIEYYRYVLANPAEVSRILKEDLLDVKAKFGDARRTRIVESVDDLTVEDLIAEENMVITLSHAGYIKRLPTSAYRRQRRGGRGVSAMRTKEEDFVESLFIASTHHYLLCFTNTGRLHWIKVYEIPAGTRASRGKAIVNLLTLEKDEKEVCACLPVAEFDEQHQVFMVTARGMVKKTDLVEFGNPRKVGIRALSLDENDALLGVAITEDQSDIVLGTRKGKAIRFHATDVRAMGRTARGVIGIRLADDDEVVGMAVARPGTSLLSVTSNGYGKRTEIDEYRTQGRGGQGIIDIKTGERNGDVVGILEVQDDDEVMIVTEHGIAIRQPVSDIRTISRNTMGVRLIRLDEGDQVVSVAKVKEKDDEANGNGDENGAEA